MNVGFITRFKNTIFPSISLLPKSFNCAQLVISTTCPFKIPLVPTEPPRAEQLKDLDLVILLI